MAARSGYIVQPSFARVISCRNSRRETGSYRTYTECPLISYVTLSDATSQQLVQFPVVLQSR
jgi:hypothetical protein